MTTETIPCPSCRNGAGPMGDCSPRPPVCLDCMGTKEVLRCDVCGRIVGSEGCEYCEAVPDLPPSLQGLKNLDHVADYISQLQRDRNTLLRETQTLRRRILEIEAQQPGPTPGKG